MKASRTIALILILIVCASAVLAGTKGSETKGKFYFKSNCKTCHTKGAEGGEITPLNKKVAQWHAYFQTGKHNHGKEPLSKYMSEEQLLHVQTFLEAHAADSLQPETCGKD